MFIEGHDELGKDFVVDDTLRELLIHVRESAQGQRGTLGD